MDATLPPVHPAGQSPSSSRLRPKPQLSCNICRLRKVKCDRKHPCDTCTSHGYASSCEYPERGVPPKHPTRQTIRRNPANALSKLNDLENLVHILMSERKQPPVPPEPTSRPSNPQPGVVEALPNDFGRLSLDATEASYVGSDHWAAVIEGIADLKTHLQDADQSSPRGDVGLSVSLCGEEGPEIFHGHVRIASREEIIGFLPARETVDSYVSTYFLQREHVPIFLHKPTFLKEYERFWTNPDGAPIMWIGLLYAIMTLGARFQATYEESRCHGSSDDSSVLKSVFRLHEYKERTVQCLLAGHYTKPGPYSIETLLLYFVTEHLHHTDGQVGNWILMGQIIRIAMRLGLHRDPSHTSKVTPFQGEIRRRMWTAIVQVDLTTSCQMGMPNMIRESYCDTREPQNFLDEDLDQDMDELPTPRPDSFITPILYICVRNRILSIFARISDITSSVKPSTYAEVLALDEELLQVRDAIPAGLQLNPSPPAPEETIDVVMYRIYIDIVFQHARCMLHRKYLVPARTNEAFKSSRAIGIESALALLQHHRVLYEETRPGGSFEMRRWKLSSLLTYGLLLGATVLCVDLNQDLDDGLGSDEHWRKPDRAEMIEALHAAQQRLMHYWDVSPDSRKGATAIGVILRKTGLSRYNNYDQHASPRQVQHYLAAQTPSWSLDEFFGSRFPQYHAWNESPPYSGGIDREMT